MGRRPMRAFPNPMSWSHLSNCLSMPVGQTSSTASRTLPACLLEELLLQQQLLAGRSDYIRQGSLM